MFRKRTGQKWITLSLGWVLQAGAKTTAGLIRAAGDTAEKTYSSYYRFFCTESWDPKIFWSHILTLVLKQLTEKHEAIYLSVDDSLWQKVGRTIEGTGWFPDKQGMYYKQMTYVFGQCWVVLGVVLNEPFGINKTVCLPVMARLYKKEEDCEEGTFRTRLELLGEMVENLGCWCPNRQFILLADRLYGGSPAIGDLPENVEAIVRMKKDSNVYKQPVRGDNPGRGRPRKKGEKLPQPQEWKDQHETFEQVELERYDKKAEVYITSRECLWYEVTGQDPGRIVIIVDQQNPDQWAAFYSTDTTIDAERISVLYSLRWSIEVLFRQAKQFGGVEDPQCRTEQSVHRQTPFNLGLVSLVKTWFLVEGKDNIQLERDRWEDKQAPISFKMMLQALRWELRGAQFFEKMGQPPNSEKKTGGWKENVKELFRSWARSA